MTILFDLDGTLVDTAPDFSQAISKVNSTLESSASLPSLDQIRMAISGGIQAIMRTAFSTVSDPIKNQLLTHYEEQLGQYAHLFEGMDQLLKDLDQQRIKWGIVTNKEERFTTPLLKQLNLLKRASCIVSGDTTPYTKPHPQPLLYACAQLQTQPEQCIYIGDAKRDIIAGKKAGMTTVVALFGYIPNREEAYSWNADHYVEHPKDIFPWYEQWQHSR